MRPWREGLSERSKLVSLSALASRPNSEQESHDKALRRLSLSRSYLNQTNCI